MADACMTPLTQNVLVVCIYIFVMYSSYCTLHTCKHIRSKCVVGEMGSVRQKWYRDWLVPSIWIHNRTLCIVRTSFSTHFRKESIRLCPRVSVRSSLSNPAFPQPESSSRHRHTINLYGFRRWSPNSGRCLLVTRLFQLLSLFLNDSSVFLNAHLWKRLHQHWGALSDFSPIHPMIAHWLSGSFRILVPESTNSLSTMALVSNYYIHRVNRIWFHQSTYQTEFDRQNPKKPTRFVIRLHHQYYNMTQLWVTYPFENSLKKRVDLAKRETF